MLNSNSEKKSSLNSEFGEVVAFSHFQKKIFFQLYLSKVLF